MNSGKKENIFKRYPSSFWILCSSMIVFMMSFNLLVPEMNEYISDLGGEDYKWMILGLWTISAAISRPFSGKIADNFSRKSVMFIGIAISVLVSLVYPLFLTVAGFLFLRFLHGFSTGFHPTGATALVADIIPKGKRGEAMGIFGVTISIGYSLGQGLASTFKSMFDVEGLFYLSSGIGLVAFLMLLMIREKPAEDPEHKAYLQGLSFWQKIIPKPNEVFAPEVMQPSFTMFLSAMCAGTYMMVVPDFSDHIGLENKGAFFTVNVLFTIVTRFVTGKMVDRYGARNNLYVGWVLYIMAAVVTAFATDIPQFLVSACIFGVASGILSPAIFAWTADLSNPKFKGRGMGTMFIALELGIASGTVMAQLVYNNKPDQFKNVFLVVALLSVIALVYLFLNRKSDRVAREY